MKTVFVIVLSLLLTIHCHAGATVLCEVSYERVDKSFSEPHEMHVFFCTGLELIKAGRTFKINPLDNYAVLSFGDSKAAILFIDDPFSTNGNTFTSQDIVNLFSKTTDFFWTQCNSVKDHLWNIRARDRRSNWIDPAFRE
jgi:hypothetical protein